MSITRRDFLNGVAISVVAGVAPIKFLNASPKQQIQTLLYPPALTGLRGSHAGSFESAHQLVRDGKNFDFSKIPPDDDVDLVIVGAGISGLASACFYQQHLGKDKKILLLDNHDDFGGHATRNEFTTPDGLLLSYGGSESLQSPRSVYSKVAIDLLKSLDVDIGQLEKGFNTTFYPNLGLSRGVYFDEKNFGVNKVVSGDPGRNVADDIPSDRLNGRSLEDFIGDFPLSETDRAALLALYQDKKDYLKGLTQEQKKAWMNSHSYTVFLREKVGLNDSAIRFFQKKTNEFMAVGIDAVPCSDARVCALPGFDGMDLLPLDPELQADLDDPYVFHFPDGNASLARLMVRKLIPGVASGNSMNDVILTKFNYRLLDNPDNNVKLRLSSTVLHAKNLMENGKEVVDVIYTHSDVLKCVRARQVIMAGYNMMIPHIVPEMPAAQKMALKKNVKAPLVHTKVIITNWRSFIKLGVHEIYSPTAPYSRVKLDYPVNIGGYHHPVSPEKPICVHMVYAPTLSGSGLSQREQWRSGRAQLLGMSFDQHEKMIREQLQGMLGSAGFHHEKDILAITVNRWAHGYSYVANTLFDDETEAEKTIETARQPVGNITIANSDANWEPYAHGAIDQGWRAVNELVAMHNIRAAS